MTKEQKLEVVRMRAEGYTFQEIGRTFGVSRQYIEKAIKEILGVRGKKCNYKYMGLNQWMRENHTSVKALAERMGIPCRTLYLRLKGHSEFKFSEIKNLLEITGMTFEEAFREQ